MKKENLLTNVGLLMLSTMVSSCSAITGIFNAGMGFGIFSVLAVIVVIVFIFMKVRKNKS